MGSLHAIVWSIKGKNFRWRWWGSLEVDFVVESIETITEISIASYEIVRGSKGLLW